MNLSVVQVIDELVFGGAEQCAIDFANKLAEKGVSSYLLATRNDGPLKDRLKSNVFYKSLGRRYMLDLGALYRFVDFIKSENIQIAHCHKTSSGMFAMLARSICGYYFRIFIHDHKGRRQPEIKERIGGKAGLLRAERYFAVSDSIRQKAQKYYHIEPSKIITLPNSINLLPQSEIQNRPAYPHRNTIATIVGEIRPEKNHICAARAALIVRKIIPGFVLRAIGPVHPDAEKYFERVSTINNMISPSAIEFVGAQHNIAEWLLQSRIGILSSDVEGFPLALLEYMSAALPVIVTDVGQCRQIVENAECGFVVMPDDPDILAEKICYLLENPDIAAEMGRRGRAAVRENYSLDQLGEKLIRLYKSELNFS